MFVACLLQSLPTNFYVTYQSYFELLSSSFNSPSFSAFHDWLQDSRGDFPKKEKKKKFPRPFVPKSLNLGCSSCDLLEELSWISSSTIQWTFRVITTANSNKPKLINRTTSTTALEYSQLGNHMCRNIYHSRPSSFIIRSSLCTTHIQPPATRPRRIDQLIEAIEDSKELAGPEHAFLQRPPSPFES